MYIPSVRGTATVLTLILGLQSCSGSDPAPAEPSAPDAPAGYDVRGALNDTGLTTCASDTETALPCPVELYPGQDAEWGENDAVAWTKLSATGEPLAIQVHPWVEGGDEQMGMSWSCIQDGTTELTWEVKTGTDTHPRWGGHTYTWFDENEATNGGMAGRPDGGNCPTAPCDTQGYAAYVNAQKLCGFDDWRLPTVAELAGLARLNQVGPAMDTRYFPNVPQPRFFTAQTRAQDPLLAWYVYFSDGSVSSTNKGDPSQLRLVRGGQ